MDNINILLQIFFGGATAWLGARFSHGKQLGFWGFVLGALAGLVGGLLFLTLFNPRDTIGSIIAAMFLALFAIFILRLAESNNVIFDPLSQPTDPNPKPMPAPHEEPYSDNGIFNFFGSDEDVAPPSKAPSKAPPKAQPKAPPPPTKTVAPETAPISYDSEMFGTGVNSLHGQSLFDTDDEIPNVPEEVSPIAQQGPGENAPDELFASPPKPGSQKPNGPTPDNPKTFTNRENPLSDLTDTAAQSRPPTPSAPQEEPYSFTSDNSIHDKTVFAELSFDETGASELGTVEDVYGANYAYDASPGIPEEDEVAESNNRSQEASPSLHQPDVVEDAPEGLEATSSIQSEAEDESEESSLEGLDSEELDSEEFADGPAFDKVPESTEGDSQPDDTPSVEDRATATLDEIDSALQDAQGIVPATVETSQTEDGISPGPPSDTLLDYPDDLTKIKGVGKVYAHRLNQMGIYTWSQVADTEPPLLKDWVAATQTANVREWPQLARSLAVTYDRVGATYSGTAPDDLTAIIGITKKVELLLYKGGIVSYKQLAEADSAALIKRLKPVKITSAAVYDWIGQAKTKTKA